MANDYIVSSYNGSSDLYYKREVEFHTRVVIKVLMRIKKRQREIMFMNEGLVDLYLYLPKGPLVEACKFSGIAYTHALKMVNIWASLNLILANKSGQQYNFFYTNVGSKLASELMRGKSFLKRNNIQWAGDEEGNNY